MPPLGYDVKDRQLVINPTEVPITACADLIWRRLLSPESGAIPRGQIENLTDDTTIGQLASLQYETDAHGRIRIESKEEAHKRGGAFTGSCRGADAGVVQTVPEDGVLFASKPTSGVERRPGLSAAGYRRR